MIKYDEFELQNGLKVLVHPDNTTPLATVNILYNVGAKHENESKTGFAHLFEHFMFEGSKNIKEFDVEMQKAGGDNNAFTTSDFTNYYETLPATNIETAFWLESDRMLELDFNQESLDTQISVVSEEFKENYINKPYGDLWHKISDLAYKKHPYKWPTIGYNLEHIKSISLDETKAFFYEYYRPKNAILTVAGNVKTSDIENLAKKWFGNLESGNSNDIILEKEPKQTETRRKTVEANVPLNKLYLAFHICDRLDKNYFAVDLLSDILGDNTTSRLYQKLVKELKIVSNVNCFISGSDENGLLIIDATLNEGVDFSSVEESVFEVIKTIQNGDVKQLEVEKVKNKSINYLSFSNISNVSKSFNMAYFKKMNRLDLLNEERNHYKLVSANEITSVAKAYLNINNCSIINYKSIQ